MTKFCNIHTYVIESGRDIEYLLGEAYSHAVNFLQGTWQLTIPSCYVYITQLLRLTQMLTSRQHIINWFAHCCYWV